MNTLSIVGYAAGGALLAGGVALIVVHMIKNGKGGDKNAKRNKKGPMLTGVGPSLMPGGAGAGASFRF